MMNEKKTSMNLNGDEMMMAAIGGAAIALMIGSPSKKIKFAASVATGMFASWCYKNGCQKKASVTGGGETKTESVEESTKEKAEEEKKESSNFFGAIAAGIKEGLDTFVENYEKNQEVPKTEEEKMEDNDDFFEEYDEESNDVDFREEDFDDNENNIEKSQTPDETVDTFNEVEPGDEEAKE